MSARIYSILLSLYPADLRRDFGAEMTQVFLDDLEDSRRRRGLPGAARVWWRSIKELCRIVLPVEVSKREIAVPLIMYVIMFVAALLMLPIVLSNAAEAEQWAASNSWFYGWTVAALAVALITARRFSVPEAEIQFEEFSPDDLVLLGL